MQQIDKILKLKLSNLAVFGLFIWFGSLILLSQFYLCFRSSPGCFNPSYLTMLAQWDGQNFLLIINQGYLLHPLYAFFPLFPLFVKMLSFIFPFGFLINGLFLNWILMGVAMLFLSKLMVMDYQKKEVIYIILFLLVFPFSFFFITFYSEALFFCLTVLSFYCYRKQQKWWTLLFLFLLTITRMAGIALVLALIVDQIRMKKNPMLYFIPFLGIVGYVLFTFYQTGNIFALINAEENWQRLVVYPGFSIFNSLNVLLTQGISFRNYGLVIDLLLVLIVIVLLIRSYKLLPGSYWFYALFSILIPLSTSTFLSFPRFLIVIFPLFIAFYLSSNTMVRVIYVLGAFVLQQLLFWSFLQGGWIA